jgi:hypothetical protein
MTMVAFLTFLQDYEMVAFYLLGLIGLRFLFLLAVAQFRLAKAKFGLEQELFQGQRNGALAKLALTILAGVGIYLAVQYGLPEAQRVERLHNVADAVNLPTVTPTPTPLELFGVDVSGCNNPKARILSPRPGEAVKGDVTIQIIADIPDFAFFKLELGSPDEPDAWVTLYTTDRTAATGTPPSGGSACSSAEGFCWVWDSTTVTPGVYHLRLTVLAADLTYPPPCVVPIQVLSAGP